MKGCCATLPVSEWLNSSRKSKYFSAMPMIPNQV